MGTRNLVEQIDESIFRIRVPLPFPLRWVNAYLLHDADGYTVIDPGLHTDDAKQCWDEALRTIGIRYSDIRQIILTHHHPDHIGMAGIIQQKSGASAFLSAAGIAQIQYLWGPEREATEELHALFNRHGMDADVGQRLIEHLEGFVALVSPLPELAPIDEHTPVLMGGSVYEAVHAPGHAYGQLMLLNKESGNLFCGDHVLPQITPNVGLLPRFDANPLASYINSLEIVLELPVKRAFPGHRDPFAGFAQRCGELIVHHQERLARIAGLLEKPVSAYEVCRTLFGQSLTIHQLRFAMAETLAHLVYLRAAGIAEERAVSGEWETAAFVTIP